MPQPRRITHVALVGGATRMPCRAELSFPGSQASPLQVFVVKAC